jgi:serine protease AprX
MFLTLRSRWLSFGIAASLVVALAHAPVAAGPYVTEASGLRWNEVGGLRWNEVGGIRWNEVGGIRWNEVGGVRWNEVGGPLLTDSYGVRWNEVGGLRWNEVGSLEFELTAGGADTRVDLELLAFLSDLPDTSSIAVIVTFHAHPTTADLDELVAIGVAGGTVLRRLPMAIVSATKQQIAAIAELPAVRSVFSNKATSFFDDASGELIGLGEVASDPDLAVPGGPYDGTGVTIAVIDSGVDATHPDLPLGPKIVENVLLHGSLPIAPGFWPPLYTEGQTDTDRVLGHGTFVASVAAGSGSASGGRYAGVAPGASVLSLSAGQLFIVHVLEAFDYVLDNADRFGVRVVNCSWGTQGWFDPDDPVNVATRALYDAGIVVVFAAGNHGPAPDSLNPYAVAPWVVGVGSTDAEGRLSEFSSRGVYEELLYHPKLVAPGEKIVGARAGLVDEVDGIAGILDPSGGASVPAEHAQFYTVSSGTSFAAPHVAGVVARMIERKPSLDPASIHRILQRTATPDVLHDRSQVGAGRLDAWAALSNVLDPARPFGTHVPSCLDARPYAIVHEPAVESAHVLPAGSTLSIPLDAAPGAATWQLSVAWGTVPGLADVDVRVLDGTGSEIARSETINGLGVFGRLEGLRLSNDVPEGGTIELFFKPGTGLSDQPLEVRQESAAPVVTAYADVADLDPADAAVVTEALARNVMVGRGAAFEPHAPMTRGELARALALAAGAPQRVPPSSSFTDLAPLSTDWPWVESVSGRRARSVLLDDMGDRFRASLAVRRIDAAVGAVRAAGLAAEADSRAGETLGLVDEQQIPARLGGYAAVALDRGLVEIVPDGRGARFDPAGKLTRIDAAAMLLSVVDLRLAAETAGSEEPAPSQDAAAGTSPRRPFPQERESRYARPAGARSAPPERPTGSP